MKKNLFFVAVALSITSIAAIADEEINYSLSIKDWYHRMQDTRATSRINAPVVSGTARKGDYFATLSMLLPATYYAEDGTYLNRRDTDLAVGWSMNKIYLS